MKTEVLDSTTLKVRVIETVGRLQRTWRRMRSAVSDLRNISKFWFDGYRVTITAEGWHVTFREENRLC